MLTKRLSFNLLVFYSVILFTGCSLDGHRSIVVLPTNQISDECTVMENGWTIPTTTLADGGVGLDGFLAMESPRFVPVAEDEIIQDFELVVIIKAGNEIKIYPHRQLDRHEIVNDFIDGIPVAITLCPLTGTAVAFERELDGSVTTFGVSGLLYNSNMILYDRNSTTFWSQMTTQAIFGPLSCSNLTYFPALEMSWKGAKEWFPDAVVLVGDDIDVRTYESIPLSSFIQADSRPRWPYLPVDTRLAYHQRVHTIIDSVKTTVYTIDQFDDKLDLIVDNTNLLITDPTIDFMISYEATSANLQLAPDLSEGVVMVDTDGNKYNLFGEVVSGEIGKRLEPTFSYMGYWFAFAAMFPDPVIFENGQD